MVNCLFGGQWGDEAKGGIADFLSRDHDIFVRANGGANAGNTVVTALGAEGETIKLNLLPSGCLKSGSTVILSKGMCIDLEKLVIEIEEIKKINPDFSVIVHEDAKIVEHKHILTDKKNIIKVGSTGKGIGECMSEFYERSDTILVRQCIEIMTELLSYSVQIWSEERILELIQNPGGKVLVQYAHGAELDMSSVGYPYVTCTPCLPVSSGVTVGVHPSEFDRIFMVMKPYSTRVGKGDEGFVELPTPMQDAIRKAGKEFGTVSGRPRRIGALNLDLLRKVVKLNKVTDIALTMMDVIPSSEIPLIYVWVNGRLNMLEPWYHTQDPKMNSFRDYLSRILNVDISITSYGASRDAKVWTDGKYI